MTTETSVANTNEVSAPTPLYDTCASLHWILEIVNHESYDPGTA
jgi:hypothetical protein